MAAIDLAPTPQAAAETALRGARPRPSEQLTAAVRRSVWILMILVVALAGPLFGWTLARARQAPPASAALPPVDLELLQENDVLAARIGRDQQAMDRITRSLDKLAAGAGGLPAQVAQAVPARAPQVHATTGAS
jgi:hypothetical protein